MKSHFKYFLAALFLSVSVFAIGVGDEVELTKFMNARYSAKFTKNAENLRGVLAPNTHGKVIEVKHFNSGNSAFLLEILDGPMKGHKVWVHFNPENPSLALEKSDGKPATKVDDAKSATTKKEVPVIRDPASEPPVAAPAPVKAEPAKPEPVKPAPVKAEPPVTAAPPASSKPAPAVSSPVIAAPSTPAPSETAPEVPSDSSGSSGSSAAPAPATVAGASSSNGAGTVPVDSGNSEGAYTPQQAVSDVLSDKLVFVGRGIPDPIRDEGGQIMTDGAAQYCVFKNKKVYVIHGGCRPNSSQSVSVLTIEVFSRAGGKATFYGESNRGNYNVQELGPDFKGTWRLGYGKTPEIEGELSLPAFFEFYNKQVPECTYGIPLGAEEHTPKIFCGGMSEPAGWRDSATSFYNSPLNFKFKEFHDAVRFKSR
jgi:hypothetical protein